MIGRLFFLTGRGESLLFLHPSEHKVGGHLRNELLLLALCAAAGYETSLFLVESLSDSLTAGRLRDEAALPAKELVATFGHGRHACPAQRFSLSAIVRTVRRLVDTYELEARFTTVRPYADQIGGVARAAEPCPVAYRRR